MKRRDILRALGLAVAGSGLVVPEWLLDPPKGRSMVAVPENAGFWLTTPLAPNGKDICVAWAPGKLSKPELIALVEFMSEVQPTLRVQHGKDLDDLLGAGAA